MPGWLSPGLRRRRHGPGDSLRGRGRPPGRWARPGCRRRVGLCRERGPPGCALLRPPWGRSSRRPLCRRGHVAPAPALRGAGRPKTVGAGIGWAVTGLGIATDLAGPAPGPGRMVAGARSGRGEQPQVPVRQRADPELREVVVHSEWDSCARTDVTEPATTDELKWIYADGVAAGIIYRAGDGGTGRGRPARRYRESPLPAAREPGQGLDRRRRGRSGGAERRHRRRRGDRGHGGRRCPPAQRGSVSAATPAMSLATPPCACGEPGRPGLPARQREQFDLIVLSWPP